jgi:hypothetical protein
MRREMRERARKIISILARTLSLCRACRGRGMGDQTGDGCIRVFSHTRLREGML